VKIGGSSRPTAQGLSRYLGVIGAKTHQLPDQICPRPVALQAQKLQGVQGWLIQADCQNVVFHFLIQN
jgi:hypothetical protein